MLGNDVKKELRTYYNITNITTQRIKAGYADVNEYYKFLLNSKETVENQKRETESKKQEAIEQQEKENKRKLKNKLKKLRKRINSKVRNITESSNDESSDDDEQEQVKPYVFFSNALQSKFDENLYLIRLLNQYYETNQNYKKFLFDNGYEKIKITRGIHKGFVDGLHFNGYMYSSDDLEISSCIHFYVENDTITKLSKIVEIF
jgi:hypothetical protein